MKFIIVGGILGAVIGFVFAEVDGNGFSSGGRDQTWLFLVIVFAIGGMLCGRMCVAIREMFKSGDENLRTEPETSEALKAVPETPGAESLGAKSLGAESLANAIKTNYIGGALFALLNTFMAFPNLLGGYYIGSMIGIGLATLATNYFAARKHKKSIADNESAIVDD